MRPERPPRPDLALPAEPPAPSGAAPPSPPLHVCDGCASPFVQPVDGERMGAAHWHIALWCPECDRRRAGVFHHDVIAQLDDELDRGTTELLESLVRVANQNREAEIARFADALQHGLILPEDF